MLSGCAEFPTESSVRLPCEVFCANEREGKTFREKGGPSQIICFLRGANAVMRKKILFSQPRALLQENTWLPSPQNKAISDSMAPSKKNVAVYHG